LHKKKSVALLGLTKPEADWTAAISRYLNNIRESNMMDGRNDGVTALICENVMDCGKTKE